MTLKRFVRNGKVWGLAAAAALEVVFGAWDASAQEVMSPMQSAAPVTPAQPQPAPLPAAGAPIILDGTPVVEGCPKPEEAKSVWAKVPPITPLPRAGEFLIAPQGKGTYSALDCLTGVEREKRPVQPYGAVSITQNSFFDADFRYLDKPDNQQTDFFDPLKRIPLGDNFLLTIGGEERLRYINEVDSRLSGRDNNYLLTRSRVYADLWYQDVVRVYAEYIDAQTSWQDLPPLAIDRNRSDFLNLFAEVKVAEIDGRPVYVRGGRQELLYGSQRLVSPLDWANTRRTFQGVKGYWHGDKLDVDLFWTQPVTPDPSHFDSSARKQNFSGAWLTYRPVKGQSVDLYYLNLDQALHVARGERGVLGAFNVSTFGARYSGDYENVLFDFEGMYQFGPWSNQEISAGAFTTALGYNFADVPFTPQIWFSYDYASGDHNPGTTDTHGTFNQLFPFGHYYFGFIDVVGRQNISDINGQVVFWPAKWVTCLAQYHHFRLDSAKDALYGAGGQVVRASRPRASGDVGDEIDLVTNLHLTQHQDVFIGYSKLYAHDFIKRTGSPRSPEYFYVQYSFKW